MPSITESQIGAVRQIIGFHDGYLKGLKIVDGGNLLIWCLTAKGLEYTILIPKPEWLFVDHFNGSNIVNCVLLYEARKTPLDLFAKVTYLDSDQFKVLLQKKFEEFTKTSKTLLEIATSDGCSFLAIFQDSVDAIKIEPVMKK